MTFIRARQAWRYHRLRDQAYADAHLLRAQAIRDFWRGANHLLASPTLLVERAARRLKARLKRRHPALPCPKRAEVLR